MLTNDVPEQKKVRLIYSDGLLIQKVELNCKATHESKHRNFASDRVEEVVSKVKVKAKCAVWGYQKVKAKCAVWGYQFTIN